MTDEFTKPTLGDIYADKDKDATNLHGGFKLYRELHANTVTFEVYDRETMVLKDFIGPIMAHRYTKDLHAKTQEVIDKAGRLHKCLYWQPELL